MSKPDLKLVQHPWPNAPQSLKDLHKKLCLIANISRLESANITDSLLREVIDEFWDTVIDVATTPAASLGRPTPQKAEPKPEQGLWDGHGNTEQAIDDRRDAILDLLSDHKTSGPPTAQGWMLSKDVMKKLGLRSARSKGKARHALLTLLEAGKIEKIRLTHKGVAWRVIKTSK